MRIVCWPFSPIPNRVFSRYAVSICDEAGECLHAPFGCNSLDECASIVDRLYAMTGFAVVYEGV